MVPIGTLISAALALGSSIYGGIKASQAVKGVKSNTEEQKAENQNWFDRRYNEDATQRADAQRLLQMTADNIKKRNQAAAGTAAVMGGTDASVAATKEANAKALADAASQIAAQGASRKDEVESQYRAREAELQGQLNNAELSRAGAITQATGGVAQAAGSAGSAYDEQQWEKEKMKHGTL